MLQEEIAKIFIQILYADESVEINKGTLEVSQATYERGKELFKEGKAYQKLTLHSWNHR